MRNKKDENIAKIEYEMVKIEIRISAMVNKVRMENGLEPIQNLVIGLKFSSDEIKNFSDNYVVAKDYSDGRIKIVPLKLKKFIGNEVDRELAEEDIKKLEMVIEDFYKNDKVRFNFEPKNMVLYIEDFGLFSEAIYRNLYGNYYNIEFDLVVTEIEEIINKRIVEKERMLSEDEIKKIVYEYLCSYNLRKDIEKLIDELMLRSSV